MSYRRCSDAFIRWWEAQPEEQVCRDCGKAGRKAYVQPQRDGGALCTDCINAHNVRARANRKAQLAAEPRCDVLGCRYRGGWRAAAGVLLCTRHKNKARDAARRDMAGVGGLALFLPAPTYTREEILEMAARP